MTSRFPAQALRPNSRSAEKLNSFLTFLSEWERHTNGQRGFLSQSTATGLRVTLSSTLSLLKYLTENVGFKYLMTSRLSQDPVEHLFGIVRQSSGCNTHPTPQQFIATVNCLSFSNLAHSVSRGNCEPAVLSSLLNADAGEQNTCTGRQKLIDRFLDDGNLDAADALLTKAAPDHSPVVVASSDSRLIFYIAGYVARKCILKTGCEECINLLLLTKEAADDLNMAELVRLKDNGGLLYPAGKLCKFVADLEESFTTCFSLLELHSESVLDVLDLVKKKQKTTLGCPEHAEAIAADVTAFYLTTRLHFFTKSINRASDKRRQASKHLKLSRC